MVGIGLSSENHCWSQKRSKRLLFPTAELPMRSSLTLMGSCGVCAIVKKAVAKSTRWAVNAASLLYGMGDVARVRRALVAIEWESKWVF
jgi:hypothetical protein